MAKTTDVIETRADAQTVALSHGAISDLPETPRQALGRALGTISGLGGIQLNLEAIADHMSAELSPAVASILSRCLSQLATCFSSAKSDAELQKHLKELEGEYRTALALLAEEVSKENRDVEAAVRNIVSLLTGATQGVEGDGVLRLEVLNLSPSKIMDATSNEWQTLIRYLEQRQAVSINCDVGFNVVSLPIQVGDPDASNAARENMAEFLTRLMAEAERLNVMFFLDVAASDSRTRDASYAQLERTLAELSWKEDGRHLGALLKSGASGQRKSKHLVLCGGVPLYAKRKRDESLPESAATPLALSPGAIAAGLLAFSAASPSGVIGVPSGETPGQGAIDAKMEVVPLEKHQKMARDAGVNIPYLVSLSSHPAFDTSKTTMAADPKFAEQGGGSVEAVVMEQLIRRLVRRYVRRLPGDGNSQDGRYKHVVGPLNAQLKGLGPKLISFNVSDNTTSDMEVQGKMKIEVSYTERMRIDKATIQVNRVSVFEGTKDDI